MGRVCSGPTWVRTTRELVTTMGNFVLGFHGLCVDVNKLDVVTSALLYLRVAPAHYLSMNVPLVVCHILYQESFA